MKYFKGPSAFLTISVITLLLTAGCNKDELNDHKIDWQLSNHRKLFDTTKSLSLNHIIHFAFLDDSTFFLYGRNHATGYYRTYLIGKIL